METLDWKCSGVDSYYAYVKGRLLSRQHIVALSKKGSKSPTGRARLCLHDNPEDVLQLMAIYHDERTIVPIHRHSPYGEHIFVKDGELELVLFDAALNINLTVRMSSKDNGDAGFYTPPNVWHTLKFAKPTIFFEITRGPFNAKITEFPPVA